MQDRLGTMPTTHSPIVSLLLLLGLGFFFGLAFEEFYARPNQKRPGGVRTFPLLALTGALLYRLDPAHLVPLSAGLLALSAWLTCYYWRHLDETDAEGFPNVGLMVPICNVLAFLLGPVALAEPPWVAVGATVAAVLLLTARAELHGFARRIELAEIVNAGRFLLLTGFVLPLLPDKPVTDLTPITPHQVWLAVVAVCTVSYASYLLQRYVAPRGRRAAGGVARRPLFLHRDDTGAGAAGARRAVRGAAVRGGHRARDRGDVSAAADHHLRVQPRPGAGIGPAAGWRFRRLVWRWRWDGTGLGGPRRPDAGHASAPANPLELVTAATFAALFVVISIATAWATQHFGSAGIYALAAIVGVSDIDPFVLNLAQGGCGADHRPCRHGRHPGRHVVQQPGQGGVCDRVPGGRARAAPAALGLLAACGVVAAVV